MKHWTKLEWRRRKRKKNIWKRNHAASFNISLSFLMLFGIHSRNLSKYLKIVNAFSLALCVLLFLPIKEKISQPFFTLNTRRFSVTACKICTANVPKEISQPRALGTVHTLMWVCLFMHRSNRLVFHSPFSFLSSLMLADKGTASKNVKLHFVGLCVQCVWCVLFGFSSRCLIYL